MEVAGAFASYQNVAADRGYRLLNSANGAGCSSLANTSPAKDSQRGSPNSNPFRTSASLRPNQNVPHHKAPCPNRPLLQENQAAGLNLELISRRASVVALRQRSYVRARANRTSPHQRNIGRAYR